MSLRPQHRSRRHGQTGYPEPRSPARPSPVICMPCRLVVVLCLAVPWLAGCAGTTSGPGAGERDRVTPAGSRPAATVLVPVGGDPLDAGLSRALAERGWHIAGYRPDASARASDYPALAAQARYRLTRASQAIGPCSRNPDRTSYRYRLALIENATGRVPITLAGADCLDTIVAAFAADLDKDDIRVRAGRAPGTAVN